MPKDMPGSWQPTWYINLYMWWKYWIFPVWLTRFVVCVFVAILLWRSSQCTHVIYFPISLRIISMVQCKTVVTPVRQQGIYCCLALSHRFHLHNDMIAPVQAIWLQLSVDNHKKTQQSANHSGAPWLTWINFNGSTVSWIILVQEQTPSRYLNQMLSYFQLNILKPASASFVLKCEILFVKNAPVPLKSSEKLHPLGLASVR